MLLMILLITKILFILFLQLSSRPNTFTIILSGLLTLLDLGPFFGLPFRRLKGTSATTLHTKFMQVTSIWSAPWCPVWNSIHNHLLLPVTTTPLPSTVSDLWISNTQSWNMQLLSNTFDNQAIQAITNIQHVPNDQQDILRWLPSKNGICTTKNIYRHLSSQRLIQLPQQGSRSILPQTNQILQRAWKSNEIPPLIKAFTWRLIRRALATADRAARYSTHIDKHCSTCGAVEDDAHLFFHCNLPRAVWFSFNPPMRTDNLPQENDEV